MECWSDGFLDHPNPPSLQFGVLPISPLVFCLLVSAAAFFPAAALGASAPVRVNIGAASVSSSMLSVWAAQEQGIFAKHGIEAQLILIRGGATLVASLQIGRAHV